MPTVIQRYIPGEVYGYQLLLDGQVFDYMSDVDFGTLDSGFRLQLNFGPTYVYNNWLAGWKLFKNNI